MKNITNYENYIKEELNESYNLSAFYFEPGNYSKIVYAYYDKEGKISKEVLLDDARSEHYKLTIYADEKDALEAISKTDKNVEVIDYYDKYYN